MERFEIYELINKELKNAVDLHGLCYEYPYLSESETPELYLGMARRLQTEEIESSWSHVLVEEVCEAFSETDFDKRVDELVQVAAVAIRVIEALSHEREAGEAPQDKTHEQG